MRRRLFAVFGIGLMVTVLTGCAITNSGPNVPWGVPASGAKASFPAPQGPVDVCATLPLARMNELSGKTFASARPDDGPKTNFACAYWTSGSHPWTWIVSVNEAHANTSISPSFTIGSEGAVKPLNGRQYPGIHAPDGVALQWGNDVVTVSDETTYKVAEASTSQYVAVAEAVIDAVR